MPDSEESMGSLKTLVFFTTANPPTDGQVELVRYFSLRYKDVFIIPLNETRKARALLPYQHRVNMARLAFENLSDVKTADVVVHETARFMDGPQTMVSLINALWKEFPDLNPVSLAMGTDVWETFHKQELSVAETTDWPAIILDVQVVIRPGWPVPPVLQTALQNDPHNINPAKAGIVVPHQLVLVPELPGTTSTAAAETREAKELLSMLSLDVLRYVERNALYACAQYRPPFPRADIRPVPRNPSLDRVQEIFKEEMTRLPSQLVAGVAPLVQEALGELLRRGITDDALNWIATYLKNNNPNKPAIEEELPGEAGESDLPPQPQDSDVAEEIQT